MNGFADRGLDEGDFGESKGISVSSFDAFPKTKQTYLTTTSNGGIMTILVTLVCIWLTLSEFLRWMAGTTTHNFSVEKGIAHDLQMNLDIVVAMRCADLHVNVQDASGDRIMAGDMLRKDDTRWALWAEEKGDEVRKLKEEEVPLWMQEQVKQYKKEEDVHEYLGKARGRKNFKATPRLRRGTTPDACRIFGSIEGNKVQGDFHITARGHGYMEFADHLEHSAFNFSHQINELSFGPYFPNLHNPLDDAKTTTDHHFYKYQYYLSVVPTIYTDDQASLLRVKAPKSQHSPHAQMQKQGPGSSNTIPQFTPFSQQPHTIFTNQYAVTEQSHHVGETAVPGIFFKYDIEPILLTVAEEWGGLLGLLVRCVNVVAGVLVAGGWVVRLGVWAGEVVGRRRGRAASTNGGLLFGGEKGS